MLPGSVADVVVIQVFYLHARGPRTILCILESAISGGQFTIKRIYKRNRSGHLHYRTDGFITGRMEPLHGCLKHVAADNVTAIVAGLPGTDTSSQLSVKCLGDCGAIGRVVAKHSGNREMSKEELIKQEAKEDVHYVKDLHNCNDL